MKITKIECICRSGRMIQLQRNYYYQSSRDSTTPIDKATTTRLSNKCPVCGEPLEFLDVVEAFGTPLLFVCAALKVPEGAGSDVTVMGRLPDVLVYLAW
jgi:hypothetical protein